MQFAIDIHSDIIIVPRGYARTGTAPDGEAGLKWTTKNASVGLNGVGLPVLFDGVNEKGLAAGTFYFPTSAGYMPCAPGDAGKTIAQWIMTSPALKPAWSWQRSIVRASDCPEPLAVVGCS
jgi:choloylglycine hydrolase